MGCYDRTHRILEEQADALIRVAEALLEHEVLDAEQIAALVKGEPLPMRPETRTDSRGQLEAARKETGDRKKQATRAGEGLPMLPQPRRQSAR